MSNSSLISYTWLSPNCCIPREEPVRKITIHHAAGVVSVETLGAIFASTSRGASANYGIGSDGRVGLYVDEANRAWTSNSVSNDCQAITIEVSNDTNSDDNWHVSDLVLSRLIELCVDICKRYNIKRLDYTGDATGNLTRHNMFAATTCPGPYLQSKFPYIAEQVNERLEADEPMTKSEKQAFEALQKTVETLEKQNATLQQDLESLRKKVDPCITSVNWDEHITGAMGGKEAVAMIHDLKAHGDFNGKDSSHYALSEQMTRLMLIFYRILNRLGLYK